MEALLPYFIEAVIDDETGDDGGKASRDVTIRPLEGQIDENTVTKVFDVQSQIVRKFSVEKVRSRRVFHGRGFHSEGLLSDVFW